MSGGGGGFGGPYIEPPKSDDCASLIFTTRLSSPVPTVIASIKIGDELDVSFTIPTAPVNVIDKAGRIAGTILGKEIARLIECLTKGVPFIAKVIKIESGNCQVTIKPQ